MGREITAAQMITAAKAFEALAISRGDRGAAVAALTAMAHGGSYAATTAGMTLNVIAWPESKLPDTEYLKRCAGTWWCMAGRTVARGRVVSAPINGFHVLRQGTVLRKTRPAGSVEVGIVRGPSVTAESGVEVVHGWLDNVPDAGIFDMPFESARRGFWRIATPEDARRARELFLEHARAWGRDSNAWVAEHGPVGKLGWATRPVALAWDQLPQGHRVETRAVLAGAYEGGRRRRAFVGDAARAGVTPTRMLTHTVEMDEVGAWVRVLCGRVALDSLADGGSLDETERLGLPTCPRCLVKDPRRTP